MGMPNLPPEISTCINIDRKGLVNVLLMSIALEEISLSHVVNAEGELMQLYIKQIRCDRKPRYEDIIKLNRNITDTLRVVLEKEKTLKEKLIQVLQFEEDQSLNCKVPCYSDCSGNNSCGSNSCNTCSCYNGSSYGYKDSNQSMYPNCSCFTNKSPND